MQAYEYSRWSILNFYLVVPLGKNNFNRGLLDVLHSKKLAFNTNFVPVLNPAYVEAFEVGDSLQVAHPKRHIVTHSGTTHFTILRLTLKKFIADGSFCFHIPVFVIWI